MTNKVLEFQQERERLNDLVLKDASLVTKRFYNLDTKAYEDGALESTTKEIAALAASLVLRCDDCIAYHTIRCKELGLSREQLMEVFNVGLVVGGSIVIPHLRRAVALLDEIEESET